MQAGTWAKVKSPFGTAPDGMFLVSPQNKAQELLSRMVLGGGGEGEESRDVGAHLGTPLSPTAKPRCLLFPPGNLLPVSHLLKCCSRIWVKLTRAGGGGTAGAAGGEERRGLIPSLCCCSGTLPLFQRETPIPSSPLQKPFGAAVPCSPLPKAPLESTPGPEEHPPKPLIYT